MIDFKRNKKIASWYSTHIFSKIGKQMRRLPFLFSLFFILFSFKTNAQEVTTSIDTATIKIGEQIRYRIAVETDSSNLVTFPEGQTFSPLEMVDAYKIDTATIDSRLRLIKEYALTQFDSGTYVIPPQRILINKREVATDSFLVEVRGVVVDTTKQKMYPIKPSLDVPDPFRLPNWVWWVLGGLILLAIIVWVLFKLIKKKQEAKKNIPPFEKAMLTLRQLDEGGLLEDREIKNYYSVLTDAARRYLDEQVDERALESTTSELILRLQMRKDAGKLNIDQKIIDDFDTILKRADLAKFARSKPDVITAKEDRGNIEKIITDTKAGIPEPTEEERQKDEAYRKKLEAKKQRREKLIWAGSGLALVVVLAVVLISTNKMPFVNGSLFGNSTQELLESRWITSEYGNPTIQVSTPRVLVRKMDTASSETEFVEEIFTAGNLYADFFTFLRTTTKKAEEENLFETVLPSEKITNLEKETESFSTGAGIGGEKISGSFFLEDKESGKVLEKSFILLTFNAGQGAQQILMVYNKGDSPSEEIASRILYSVELKKRNS